MTVRAGQRAAIYTRISLDRKKNRADDERGKTFGSGGDGLGVARQEQDCRELADRLQLTVDPAHVFVDNDLSAYNGKLRPRYEALLDAMKNGEVDVVIAWHTDRLYRHMGDLERFVDVADAAGVEIRTVNSGDLDLSNSAGRMIARILGSVARQESEHKGERQRRANEQRAKSGKAWTMRSFGYDGDKLVKREANAIRKAYRGLLNGASLFSIAAQWNTAGLKTVNGNDWTGGTVRQVLLRPRNAGLQVRGTRAASAASKIHETVLEGVKASWPAIVDREDWESVCRLLADPKRHTGKSPGRKHLLTGIAVCGVCHRPLNSGTRGTKGHGRKPVYQCKQKGCGKILRDLVSVDGVVIDVITRRLAKSDAVAALFTPTVDTAAVRDEITRLQAQIRQAEADYDDDLITAQRMNAKKDRINAKLTPLQDKLLGVHMGRDVRELAGKPDAYDRFMALPLDRRRGVIDTLAVVTIRRQVKGGRFDPTSVTVEPK